MTRTDLITITIDKNTLTKIDKFRDKRGLSRSAAIRFLVNESFLRGGFIG